MSGNIGAVENRPGFGSANNIADLAATLAADADRNQIWRRHECINLIPSEQPTSAHVDRLITSEPAARYNEHNRAKGQPLGAPHIRYYKGTDFIMEKEAELQAALKQFFGCSQVEPRVISGQMANDTVYDALKQFRKGHLRSVLVHRLKDGGHLSAQPMGALKNYLQTKKEAEGTVVWHFPSDPSDPYRIDVERTKSLIDEHRPELLVFGRSVILQKEPVREIVQFIHAEYGSDNPDRPMVMYDGAHVMGLIGTAFQDPLAEGADILTGSTHKTFFGPQRGVILSNISPDTAFAPLWSHIEARTFPGHVSNHHLGTMLGLLGATYEMLRFREEYPHQVIRNAKAFANALSEEGLVVEGNMVEGFTETHQVVLRLGPGGGNPAADLLETHNIITNAQGLHDDASFTTASGLRLGTQEMTRYGMKEADFAELARMMARIVTDQAAKAGIDRETIVTFRRKFTQMRYCF